MLAHELQLTKRVIRVVSRIPFVTGQLEHLVDSQTKVSIDLDETMKISLIAAEGAPWLAVHVLYGHGFAWGKVHICQSPLPATLKRTVHDRREAIRRDKKCLIER